MVYAFVLCMFPDPETWLSSLKVPLSVKLVFTCLNTVSDKIYFFFGILSSHK